MSTETSSQTMTELQIAIASAQAGVRDPAAAQQACERMDRMREELRKKIGIVDLAVELIREVRNP